VPLLIFILNALKYAGDQKAFKIGNVTYNFEQLSLIASCCVLILAICNLVRISKKSKKKKTINYAKITLHILFYLGLTLADILTVEFDKN